MSSRKFVLIAFGTLMSAPLWAQGGGTSVAVPAPGRVLRRTSALDTMRAMLLRRNPTIDEVVTWSADVARKYAEMNAVNERARREYPAADEARFVQLKMETIRAVEEWQSSQRLLIEACNAIRPHQKESEGILGFQIEKSTNFQNKTPVVKEERFVRTPEIVFVEPNTPAAKADVREGDIWMAIAGRDLVNTYVRDLNDVLTPGNRIDLKLLRDGREIKVEVTAQKRRDYPEDACNTDKLQIQMFGANVPRIQLFNGPLPANKEFFAMKFTRAAFSGAAFVDLTDAKRERLKVPAGEKGVLVESVDAGSPAELAGLHELDVVLRANNEVIESAMDLMKIFRSGRQVALWIWDGSSQRGITLPSR
jgi:C-terminal processing protease CtpA/Prc